MYRIGLYWNWCLSITKGKQLSQNKMCNIFMLKHVFFHCASKWEIVDMVKRPPKAKVTVVQWNLNKTSFACSFWQINIFGGNFFWQHLYLLTILICITFFDLIFDTIFHRNQWDLMVLLYLVLYFFCTGRKKCFILYVYVSFGELISKVNPYGWNWWGPNRLCCFAL